MRNWYQQTLTQPEVLELNARLGVIPQTDHLQVLVELKDPTTGVLLGQWSRPHGRMRDLETFVDWVGRTMLRAVDDAVGPF